MNLPILHLQTLHSHLTARKSDCPRRCMLQRTLLIQTAFVMQSMLWRPLDVLPMRLQRMIMHGLQQMLSFSVERTVDLASQLQLCQLANESVGTTGPLTLGSNHDRVAYAYDIYSVATVSGTVQWVLAGTWTVTSDTVAWNSYRPSY